VLDGLSRAWVAAEARENVPPEQVENAVRPWGRPVDTGILEEQIGILREHGGVNRSVLAANTVLSGVARRSSTSGAATC